VITGSGIVTSVGRSRNRPRLNIVRRERPERQGQWVGRKRNRTRPWNQKCDRNALNSFLEQVGYPLREDPVDVPCVREASLLQVTLEALGRTEHLALCKNHCQWVNERENKLRDLDVKVAAPR